MSKEIQLPDVYIAGPLFNAEENSRNVSVANLFREAGYRVFNPIEDGIEGASVEGKSEHDLVTGIYELDRERVRGCRIFVANLNGPVVDDGTAVEIGIASERQREEGGTVEVMIGYFNDTRSFTPNMRRNPMPLGPFLREPNRIFKTSDEIFNYAKKHFPPQK